MQENTLVTTQEAPRLPRSAYRLAGLDTLRGLALISMIAYHGCWDMVYLFGKDWAWYRSPAAAIWQQSICWTFILLSGFCFRLGYRHFRQGLYVFAAGGLIMAVTAVIMPETRIFFGVLSLLGAATLLTIPMDAVCYYYYVPGRIGLLISFTLFALTWHVPNGYLGLGAGFTVDLPDFLYSNLWTACLGFPPENFSSTDYFPLLPWLFLFWTGYFLFDLRPEQPPRLRIPLVTFLGRHSLLIYLIHQPLLYGALELYQTHTISLFANFYAQCVTFYENSVLLEIVREYWPDAKEFISEYWQKIVNNYTS